MRTAKATRAKVLVQAENLVIATLALVKDLMAIMLWSYHGRTGLWKHGENKVTSHEPHRQQGKAIRMG
ncbi:hypothetical protein [Hoeflea sp.]|uniref:hypothetical protein n=1 Tax=Hoeflea sp. TaxID=1940281 RepID=UPI003B524927